MFNSCPGAGALGVKIAIGITLGVAFGIVIPMLISIPILGRGHAPWY